MLTFISFSYVPTQYHSTSSYLLTANKITVPQLTNFFREDWGGNVGGDRIWILEDSIFGEIHLGFARVMWLRVFSGVGSVVILTALSNVFFRSGGSICWLALSSVGSSVGLSFGRPGVGTPRPPWAQKYPNFIIISELLPKTQQNLRHVINFKATKFWR